VLARLFEAAGFSTVLVTMMPYLAEAMGVPRALGVEFPFGHPLGLPRQPSMQRRVIEEALRLLAEARGPGEVRHLDMAWPVDLAIARRAWHPLEPSPIVRAMREQLRAMRREGG